MQDDEVARFRAQMRMLQRRLRSELPPVPGMTRTLLQVLRAIGRLADGSQPSQVAESLQMTSSNVAASLRELETAGLIRRQKDATDARRTLLFVTQRGAALMADFSRERDTWLGKAMAATLSEEEKQQLFAAGRLLQRLAEYEPPAVRP